MPRELNWQELDLIYDKKHEIEMEPCDLYDVCEDCPNYRECVKEG
jgi:hypothetical protein